MDNGWWSRQIGLCNLFSNFVCKLWILLPTFDPRIFSFRPLGGKNKKSRYIAIKMGWTQYMLFWIVIKKNLLHSKVPKIFCLVFELVCSHSMVCSIRRQISLFYLYKLLTPPSLKNGSRCFQSFCYLVGLRKADPFLSKFLEIPTQFLWTVFNLKNYMKGPLFLSL